MLTITIKAYLKPESVAVEHIDAARLCAAAEAVG